MLALLFVFAVIFFVFWLITFPLRLLLRLVFGVIGFVLRIAFAPILLMLAALGVVIAFVAALVALLAPLLPFAVLAAIVWGIYRVTRPRGAVPV